MHFGELREDVRHEVIAVSCELAGRYSDDGQLLQCCERQWQRQRLLQRKEEGKLFVNGEIYLKLGNEHRVHNLKSFAI